MEYSQYGTNTDMCCSKKSTVRTYKVEFFWIMVRYGTVPVPVPVPYSNSNSNYNYRYRTSLFHQKVDLGRNSRVQYRTLRKIKIIFLFNFSSIVSCPFSIPYIYTVLQYRTSKWRNIELGPVLLVLFYVSKTRCAVYANIDRICII